MCGGPMSDSKWQAEDDHRTLTRAAEVTNDPQRMKGVAEHHAKVKKDLAQVGRRIGRGKQSMSGGRR